MRYILIDKILKLERNKSMVGIKTFSKDEDIFITHFPNKAVIPPTLIMEAIGQLAVWLIKVSLDFRVDLVVSRVERAEFISNIEPGDQLLIEAEVLSIDREASNIRATVRRGDVLIASVERMLLGHVTSFTDPKEMAKKFTYVSDFVLDR